MEVELDTGNVVIVKDFECRISDFPNTLEEYADIFEDGILDKFFVKDKKVKFTMSISLEKNGKKIIAAVDCTGHGVPGAFMSMVGTSLLNEIVNEKNVTTSSEILNKLKDRLITTLQQTGAEGESKDGMDIAICCISNGELEFSGANNPMYLVRKSEIVEIKGDKHPIGIHMGREHHFGSHKMKTEKGDCIYIFSDGYADQFGGPKEKKFKQRKFIEMLLEYNDIPMHEQENFLRKTIVDWQGANEQVDDMLVIGFRI